MAFNRHLKFKSFANNNKRSKFEGWKSITSDTWRRANSVNKIKKNILFNKVETDDE